MPPHQDPPTLLQLLEALSPQDRERVAELMASYNWKSQRSRAIQDIRNNLTTRVLHNGNDVNTDTSGNQVGMTNTGRSQFPVINLIGGTASVNSATNGVQVDISFGGGADCMFDMLVSSCFATLPGFTEGQVFSSLSGCTFKGYSTVSGAVATLNIFTGSKVIYICSGTYNENVSIPNTSATDWIHIEGAGRDRTMIAATSSATSTFITNPTGNYEIAHLSIKGNGSNNCFQAPASNVYVHDVNLYPQSGGTGAQFTSGVRASNVRIQGTSASLGWYLNTPSAGGPRVDMMDISGCATGINIQGGTDIIVTNTVISNATTVGLQPGTAVASLFSGITFDTCAKGINFSSTAGWVSTFTDLTFYLCTIGIDLSQSTLVGGNSGLRQCQFNDMMFIASAGTDNGIKANGGSAAVLNSQFSQLNFSGYTSGNEILGTSSFGTGTTVFHNTSNNGPLADFGNPVGHSGLPSGSTSAPASAAGVAMSWLGDLSSDSGRDDAGMLFPPGLVGAPGTPGSTGPPGPQGLGLDGNDGEDGQPIPAPAPVNRVIEIVLDGGGSTLTTGVRPPVRIPFACTVKDWAIQGDAAGTCTIDLQTASDNATPSYTSIVGAGTKPNVAGPAVATVATAPASWTTTTITLNQYLQANLSAVATFKWLTLSLTVSVP